MRILVADAVLVAGVPLSSRSFFKNYITAYIIIILYFPPILSPRPERCQHTMWAQDVPSHSLYIRRK